MGDIIQSKDFLDCCRNFQQLDQFAISLSNEFYQEEERNQLVLIIVLSRI